MHQLPTYSRGLVPRPCSPATFVIVRSKPKAATLQQQLKAAYDAVNMCLDFSVYENRRQVIEVWKKGPECLFIRLRIRPIVIARALVMYYQRYTLNKRVNDCKKVFKMHHTSIMYLTQFINGQLDTRFPNDVQDSWNTFLKLIEK